MEEWRDVKGYEGVLNGNMYKEVIKSECICG